MSLGPHLPTQPLRSRPLGPQTWQETQVTLWGLGEPPGQPPPGARRHWGVSGGSHPCQQASRASDPSHCWLSQ